MLFPARSKSVTSQATSLGTRVMPCDLQSTLTLESPPEVNQFSWPTVKEAPEPRDSLHPGLVARDSRSVIAMHATSVVYLLVGQTFPLDKCLKRKR